jgi:hypothetical protein
MVAAAVVVVGRLRSDDDGDKGRVRLCERRRSR